MKQYNIQYHNFENMGYFPNTYKMDINSIEFETKVRDNFKFFTRKRMVEKSIGSYCFMIVGEGKKDKSFYLWSLFKIDNVESDANGYSAYGTGFNFSRPIKLNNVTGFAEFKSECGNFAFGFKDITNNDFCETLVEFADNVNQLENSKAPVFLNQF